MSNDLAEIVRNFNTGSPCVETEAFGTGLVHNSFKISCEDGKRFLLQHFNTYVFREPEKVMENINRVLDHLGGKIKSENLQIDPERTLLRLVPAHDGKMYFVDRERNYWRMYHFIERTKVFDTVENPGLAFQASKMFGRFAYYLSDLNPGKIHITIPGFHDLDHRYKQLNEAVKNDPAGRKKELKKELEFAFDHHFISEHMNLLVSEKGLPLRVTHNDTKISNVLMDEKSLKGLCVIDLDTIMPSTILSDFGDMIRTFTPSVSEEEKDSGKVDLRLDIFKAMAEGFLSETRSFLKDIEKQSLVFGGAFLTLMQGIRFLTDYIDGDIYYKSKYPGHNLMRSRNQFTLFSKIMENREKMESIISDMA